MLARRGFVSRVDPDQLLNLIRANLRITTANGVSNDIKAEGSQML